MSTDWHVHCLDCKDTHRFDDANHRDEFMLLLCKHADSIAAVAGLLAAGRGDVALQTAWGRIDADWFLTHQGHNLIPIDEYGRVLGKCCESVACGECATSHRCALEHGHDGPHARGD